jgi:hypothetical protein
MIINIRNLREVMLRKVLLEFLELVVRISEPTAKDEGYKW